MLEKLVDAEELRGLNSAVDKITRYLAETLDAAPVALRQGETGATNPA